MKETKNLIMPCFAFRRILLDCIFAGTISTVDQGAPYYRADGYWNGAVWMPHQWFFWKTMFDHGYPDLAFRIANTALELWKRETEATYNCYEHFIVQSGRGAGWHHFGGLSAPVINWFAAYYELGKVTTGFNVWILQQHCKGDYTEYDSEFHYAGQADQPFHIRVNLAEGLSYEATGKGCDVICPVILTEEWSSSLATACRMRRSGFVRLERN